MKYFSLNDPDFKVNFKEAVIMGQAPGKGLFFPESIPQLPSRFQLNLKQYSKTALAIEVLNPFTEVSIDEESLSTILEETLDFDFPLVQISESIFSLELFHGPTGAFKDVGARFLSRCLQYFSKDSHQKFTILVATSGDTGGAVADAFYGLDNVEVVILFPSGRVSELQRLQLTTYGNNIKALEVEGTFDDCQALVKQALADESLKTKFRFTSANSINVARWISQQVYYFLALQQWPYEKAPVISVPSGNLGNLAAGMLGNVSGLKIEAFVASCNDNKAIVDYLESGVYQECETISTISNAMDVGNPSNFKRILQCLSTSGSTKLRGYSFNSDDTRETIEKVYGTNGYILDPHGAVAYLGLNKYLNENPGQAGIFLETAHPAKFENIVAPLVNGALKMPERFSIYEMKHSDAMRIPSKFDALKQLLLSEN